jgi:hypothetical protein
MYVIVDISYQLAMFAAILAASGYFLYLGIIGTRGDEKEIDAESR